MFQIVIHSHFDAAHFLRNYQGKCANLHGHRWDVEVCIKGIQLDECGMLFDFGILKSTVKNILNDLDHQLLNDLHYFSETINPTAENIAYYLYNTIKNKLDLENSIQFAWVKVYESPDSWAVFEEDDV